MERTINDIVRESEEQGDQSQWVPEDDEDAEDDHKVCPDCGEWVYDWRCSMCGYIFTDSLPF